MKSKLILLGVVVLFSVLGTSFYFYSSNSKKTSEANNCVFEVKTCPDGTHVSRIGKNCEFAQCPTSTATTSPLKQASNASSSTITSTTSSFTKQVPVSPNNNPQTPTQAPQVSKPSFLSSVASSVASLFSTITTSIKSVAAPSINPSTYISNNQQNNTTSLPPSDFAGEKYIVKDGQIISNNNTVVYTIPGSVMQSVASSTPGWESSIVNVVPVGNVAPIINAIPVQGLPGKYYLSENSFGNIENCEFSNKIFILDSATGQLTLMYEENNQTLSRDDPRACNSEIFLLATDANMLILKYHTLKTNTLCDSAWSEPEKTYFLDVTQLSAGMKKYNIPDSLSATAEQEEAACRAQLQ